MNRLFLTVLAAGYACCSHGEALKMENFHSVSPDIAQAMADKQLSELDLWSNQEFSSRDWVLHHKLLADFDRGIQNGFWRDMHRNPTIAMTASYNWSACRAVRVTLESEVKSNNIITLAFRSDNSKGRGYYCFEIPLDFIGEKKFELEFANAKTINRPAGWHAVSGIYLFSKANGHRPNPYASMRIKEIEPLAGEAKTPVTSPELFQIAFPDRPTPNLNHSWPEDQTSGAVVSSNKFITYQHHGRSERDLFAYYPRFNPGYVSFSPEGKSYIAAGELIQWLDANGNWQAFSLRPHLEKWAREKGYAGVYYNWGSQGSDPAIRFDRQGNIYILAQLEALDKNGKRYDWRTRSAVLFFSPDHFKTVSFYQLPLPIASFEKIDGNNQAALERPPVVMLSSYSYFNQGYTGLKFVVPSLSGDGLRIGEPVEIAETAIGCNYHSGDGNIVLSSRDKLFIIWGWLIENWPNNERCSKLLGELKGKPWTVDNLAKTSRGGSLPKSFPGTDAPARNLKFDSQYHYPFHSRFLPVDSSNGVPTFITEYDLKTGQKSAPVYLGSAGSGLDGHNWGAISFDPQGYLEVLINGHHNPPQYTRSKKPHSAEEFEPVRFIQPEQHLERCSYGSLTCDTAGTLYSFHRSTTGTYNNRLVMFRKKAGQPWEAARTIAAPSKLLYYVWSHRVTINPRNNDLYLTYLSFAAQSFWTPDYYETMRFIYPELEETQSPERMALRSIRHWESWENGNILAGLRGAEPVILVSKDSGETWSLAKSEDFK